MSGPQGSRPGSVASGAVLSRMVPRRVLVSFGVSCVLVGGVVLAGALLRHHDPARPATPASSVATTAAAGSGGR